MNKYLCKKCEYPFRGIVSDSITISGRIWIEESKINEKGELEVPIYCEGCGSTTWLIVTKTRFEEYKKGFDKNE